jgi:hypothetical protein
MVAQWGAITKVGGGGGQQCNNQLTTGAAKGGLWLVSSLREVDDSWHQKQPTTRMLTVTQWRAMTKAGSAQKCNFTLFTGDTSVM